jgi:Asp-tRNA(Asn)/Glu-tRNA(Gln) amidotransferase A subunit family amidase
MAANVRDAALLLDVIAGSDVIDDRQPGVEFRPHGAVQYTRELDAHLAKPAADNISQAVL